ncbi:trichohyalin isoform X2 [Parambassis ranga]|uniref:Trichohyalin isoform X2 n=1 Tax=Parambassis ranga TaxID=210632 RepID=A0A6P7JXE0_9TELE|nr:trichohyalin-like isoform X2 [Parambassis ranga]
MGTKRPSCTLFDTISSINTSDRNSQPGGKISRDPSPRPAMTAQSKRERDSNLEENWRRDSETEKIRDKGRYKDMDRLERYYDRDRDPAARPRDRRHEDERTRNGRLLSNVEKETERKVTRGVKKGDTFPRMRKGIPDPDIRMMPEICEERGERRPKERDRPKRAESDEWDKERERAWQRERYRDEMRSREKEEGRNSGGRPVEDERSRQKERYGESDVRFQDRRREGLDLQEIREKDALKRREKPRPGMQERDAIMPSPQRRRDREIYTDKKEKEKTHRREGKRDTRSEGDSDERDLRRERVKDREREELIYQHSKSEGDNNGKPARERDREWQGYRQEDRQREREADRSRRRGVEKSREQYREGDRRAVRPEGERWKQREDRGWTNDRRKEDRYRAYEQKRDKERKDREPNPRWDDMTGGNEASQRAPPQTQSSGVWSSDVDNETRYRRDRDIHADRQFRRDLEDSQKQQTRSEGQERDMVKITGTLPEQRRMWLEPQRGKNSKEEFVHIEKHTRRKERRRDDERVMESQAEWGRAGRRVKEEPDERSWDQSSFKGRHGERGKNTDGETEGVSVDGDEVVDEIRRETDKRGERHLSDSKGGIERSWQRDAEGENVTDNTEDSDREEEGGSEYLARSESEGGSEAGCKQERDSMLSGEDGFVTVSSGGDEEDEREDDEEEEFEDCQEFLGGGVTYEGTSPVGFKGCEGDKEREEEWTIGKEETVDEEEEGSEKKPKYIFFVIGQTLPRSGETSQSQVEIGGVERHNPNLETHHLCSDDASQQSQDDPQLSRNDEHPIIHNQDTEGECNAPRLERSVSGETTEGDIRYTASSELQETESGDGMRSTTEHPYAEIGEINRDSETERLLKEWRDKNKEVEERQREQTSPPSNPYADVYSEQIQPILDQIHSRAMSPEQVEAIRIRLSGAWSMSEEPKRHSQAPHLKWAKNVVREILGNSEEQVVDELNTEEKVDQVVNQPEISKQQEKVAQVTAEIPAVKLTVDEHRSEPELEEEELLEVEGFREGKNHEQVDQTDESEEERQGGEPEEWGTAVEVGRMIGGEASELDSREGERKVGTLKSTYSFRDLGPQARMRRRGIRKTTERRKDELVELEEEEGVGRDRRTRIFSTTDEDDRSKSWGEMELRNVLDTIEKRKRNSRFFNAAQLYQQYSEAAQNFEILRQSRSDVLSVCEDNTASPAPSPPPARRPLPPLPLVRHPHSKGSIISAKSLPLPEPPRNEGRPPSPRLSVSLTQSATLWRDLPGVRNSHELEELTEDQRRLQEVRFEVVTSEASYCCSLDIVVEHFVKSKQLGALLTTQDRNWLFSRLADVRAISHSFLSKLEERMESDIVHFTVCDIIARHCQRFKMVYVPYLTNQSYQDATYQRLMNENPGFKRIVETLERSPVCQRLPLRSFLVLPFQRITRIKLLVQNIVKRTTPGTAEAMQAIKALKLLEKLIQESNDSISQMKSIESLVSLSAKVDFECRTLPLISQSRRLVREGPVTELMDFSLKDTERNIYLHLFNDYLLLSLQKEGGRFTVIDHSPVSDLRAENCRVKLHSLQKNLFRLHMPHKALLLRTDTQSDKLRWISALSRPHPEIDFSAAQDFAQMQCIRGFVSQQPDELSLDKADVILVHQESGDNWVEGTRLSDRHRGWVPKSHLETISNSRVRQRNLADALKLTTATAAV